MRRAGAVAFLLGLTCLGGIALASVQVPNVVGETEESATVTLTGLGLVVDITYAVGDPGVVSAQNPAPSSVVEDGATVALTVGRDETADENGSELYGVVLNHVLTMFAVGTMVGMFIKLTNRS